MRRCREGDVGQVADKIVRDAGDSGLPRGFSDASRRAALSTIYVSGAGSAAASPKTKGGAALIPDVLGDIGDG